MFVYFHETKSQGSVGHRHKGSGRGNHTDRSRTTFTTFSRNIHSELYFRAVRSHFECFGSQIVAVKTWQGLKSNNYASQSSSGTLFAVDQLLCRVWERILFLWCNLLLVQIRIGTIMSTPDLLNSFYVAYIVEKIKYGFRRCQMLT